MDSVRSGPFGQIFRPDNFVFGRYIDKIADLLISSLIYPFINPSFEYMIID
jgi:hypothetical protein